MSIGVVVDVKTHHSGYVACKEQELEVWIYKKRSFPMPRSKSDISISCQYKHWVFSPFEVPIQPSGLFTFQGALKQASKASEQSI